MRTLSKLALSLLCIPVAAIAQEANVQNVPTFKDGLKTATIIECEKKYKAICHQVSAKPTDASANPQDECIAKKMEQDKACEQASAIRKLVSYPANHFKKYGDITVFQVTTLADGIDIFYMVDKSGNLISLTDNVDLGSNEAYQKLKEKFPSVSLSTLLDWTRPNENLFPKLVKSSDGSELVFRQTLRDGGCVACATVGSVEVAYEFSANGIYQGTKLLEVKSKS